MKKNIIFLFVLLISSISINANTLMSSDDDKKIDISIIIQAAQRAYYMNNDYSKAMDLLTKATNYLQVRGDSKYDEIVDVNWFQIKFTLLEKGAVVAQPLVEDLMNRISAYHSVLKTGFSNSENAVNLMLCENISKHFIYFPGGIEIIGSMLDSFSKIYKNDFSGEPQLRLFQSSKSYISLLSGNKKAALDISVELMKKADKLEKSLYAMNYGHALYFNEQGVDKAKVQYKSAFDLSDEIIAKSILMDFQMLRQLKFDLSGISCYENEVRTKYVSKYYKKPQITEIKPKSEAERVGLKVGDIIKSYNNDLIYDLEMFGIERKADNFKQNLQSREVIVLRNGKQLTLSVAPGLLGVYMDYEK